MEFREEQASRVPSSIWVYILALKKHVPISHESRSDFNNTRKIVRETQTEKWKNSQVKSEGVL